MINKIAVIHGPNLNLLGTREPQIYGSDNLDSLNQSLTAIATPQGVELLTFQSNSEGAIIDFIQQCRGFRGVIINAGAYTHTSIGIRDALLGIEAKFIEVHISNVFAREQFRHHSYLSDKAIAVITGLGVNSYKYALMHFLEGK